MITLPLFDGKEDCTRDKNTRCMLAMIVIVSIAPPSTAALIGGASFRRNSLALGIGLYQCYRMAL